ncbi:membrane-spanning 4-domains subfamily A member 4A [Amia ocellicauda]|uniref:membrane-spanning 4-domains subfamily A member 4A n=1 Tax=Amia ocellicauda TaxID=2972642 RepID=UPI003463B5A9
MADPSVLHFSGLASVTPEGAQFSTPSTYQLMANSDYCQAQEHLRKFLKGEPKVLGAVQITIAVMILLTAVVQFMSSYASDTFVMFFGAIFYIISGSLCIAANQNLRSDLIKAALAMNIVSSIVAFIGVILYIIDLIISSSYNLVFMSQGVNGVMLVLSLLELCISISISAFGCKATCNQSLVPSDVVQQFSTTQMPSAPAKTWYPQPQLYGPTLWAPQIPCA